MLHFMQEPQFTYDLQEIEPNEQCIDGLTELIEDEIRNTAATIEVYAAVQIQYGGRPAIIHFCKTGCFVTMLSATTGGKMKAR